MNPSVLVVDDEVRYRQLYVQTLASGGFQALAAASAEEAIGIINAQAPDMVVSDVRMPGADGIALLQTVRQRHPDLPFLLVTAYADVRDAVKALKLGAVDYLAKPVDLDELLAAIRDGLGLRRNAAECDVPPEAMEGIVAESSAMRGVLRDAYRVAQSDANVLLVGESGAGKEVVAQFIHRNSPRRNGPLVAVNCAAIPGTLLASELFGHERGAFTGAVEKRLGRFREAQGGTLFLDEIGDMPLELQASLLRAIETGRISSVGSDKEVAVDYRLLAATNHDLLPEVEQHRFRADLYYRLNVIAIETPPLRERTEDILPLARHFLARARAEGKRLSHAAARLLTAYSWPGNVRELANAMEHAGLLCQTDVILPEHLPPVIAQTAGPLSARDEAPPSDRPEAQTLQATERKAIQLALERTGGNRTRAAEMLGITRRGLIYKLKRLGIE